MEFRYKILCFSFRTTTTVMRYRNDPTILEHNTSVLSGTNRLDGMSSLPNSTDSIFQPRIMAHIPGKKRLPMTSHEIIIKRQLPMCPFGYTLNITSSVHHKIGSTLSREPRTASYVRLNTPQKRRLPFHNHRKQPNNISIVASDNTTPPHADIFQNAFPMFRP